MYVEKECKICQPILSSIDERQNHFRVCQIENCPTCNKSKKKHPLAYLNMRHTRTSVMDLIISNVQVVIKDLNQQNKYTKMGFIIWRNIFVNSNSNLNLYYANTVKLYILLWDAKNVFFNKLCLALHLACKQGKKII